MWSFYVHKLHIFYKDYLVENYISSAILVKAILRRYIIFSNSITHSIAMSRFDLWIHVAYRILLTRLFSMLTVLGALI